MHRFAALSRSAFRTRLAVRLCFWNRKDSIIAGSSRPILRIGKPSMKLSRKVFLQCLTHAFAGAPAGPMTGGETQADDQHFHWCWETQGVGIRIVLCHRKRFPSSGLYVASILQRAFRKPLRQGANFKQNPPGSCV